MMRKLLLLLLAALLPASVQAASSVAGSFPTNALALTDGGTINVPCPGTAGASGFYTLTVTGNNHVISLPKCTLPLDFKFAITQGPGGPFTGLSFSSAGTIAWAGGTAYTQTNKAGALDYVGGTISNLSGSNEWDVTSITNVSSSFALLSHQVSTTGTTTGINTTGAALIVVGTSVFNNTSVTVTDSVGGSSNTWTQVGTTQTIAGNESEEMFYTVPTHTGAGHTFSCTGGCTIAAVAFSGPASATPLDQTSGNNIAAAISVGASVTPTQSNELIVTFLGQQGSQTYSVDSGYTITDNVNFSNAQFQGAAMAYLIQNTAAATTPTWSWSGSGEGAMTIGSFK